MNILVTAAAGNLGTAIISELSNKHSVVGGVRNPDNANKIEGLTYRKFDYDDMNTFTDALEGIDVVVLQAPPLDAEAFERLSPFIDAMNKRGIKHVAFISAFGVDHNDQAPLRKIELKLINDGFSYTILRPNFFMENFISGFAAAPLEHENIIISSAGDGKLAFVSIKDIASVVAAVCSEPKHENTAYNLTGDEAFSHNDIAKIISTHSKKDVRCVSVSGEELKGGAIENGLPESCADYLVMLYDLAAQGLLSGISHDIEAILGRKPLYFSDVYSLT